MTSWQETGAGREGMSGSWPSGDSQVQSPTTTERGQICVLWSRGISETRGSG